MAALASRRHFALRSSGETAVDRPDEGSRVLKPLIRALRTVDMRGPARLPGAHGSEHRSWSLRIGVPASVLALFFAVGLPPAADAGTVLDRIKASGIIRCGAAPRPGLFDPGAALGPRGLLVDLCRAVGVAAAGRAIAVEMSIDESDQSYDPMRAGADDLMFLSGAEIVDHKLGGAILPGPAVFYETSAVMVLNTSPVRHPADLAGQPICFLQGDVSHRHIEAWFAARNVPFERMGYQEEVEMYDAFEAQVCKAMAGEATTLAEVRLGGGANRRNGRILTEPLATFPIIAATGTTDAAWSAVVGWTIMTLKDADRPTAEWAAGGLDSLPLDAAPLGLEAGWQRSILDATGSYATMLRLNVGEGSPLKLPAGPNALAGQGGLMAPLYAE